MLRILYYKMPSKCLEIHIEEETITRVNFCEKALNRIVEGSFEEEVLRQFAEYFSGKRQEFDLPYFATGTPFQLMVWEELLKIPYGETRSYWELAEAIGKPKAARAVGNALNANPVAIIIPCHRVIASGGKLGGFGGGTELKRQLLELEKRGKL